MYITLPLYCESNRRALVVVGDDFQLAQGPGYASLHVSQRVQQRISADEQLWRQGGVVCDYAYVKALTCSRSTTAAEVTLGWLPV